MVRDGFNPNPAAATGLTVIATAICSVLPWLPANPLRTPFWIMAGFAGWIVALAARSRFRADINHLVTTFDRAADDVAQLSDGPLIVPVLNVCSNSLRFLIENAYALKQFEPRQRSVRYSAWASAILVALSGGLGLWVRPLGMAAEPWGWLQIAIAFLPLSIVFVAAGPAVLPRLKTSEEVSVLIQQLLLRALDPQAALKAGVIDLAVQGVDVLIDLIKGQ